MTNHPPSTTRSSSPSIGPQKRKESRYSMNVRKCSKYIGIGEKSIYRLVEAGEIPHTRIFKKHGIRFDPNELDAWLASKSEGGTG